MDQQYITGRLVNHTVCCRTVQKRDAVSLMRPDYDEINILLLRKPDNFLTGGIGCHRHRDSGGGQAGSLG